jgi:hypothetical protein
LYNVDLGVYGYLVTSFEQASRVSVQRPPLMLYTLRKPDFTVVVVFAAPE